MGDVARDHLSSLRDSPKAPPPRAVIINTGEVMDWRDSNPGKEDKVQTRNKKSKGRGFKS